MWLPGRPRPEFSPGDLINKRYLVQYRAAGGSNDVYLCLEAVTYANVAVKLPRPHERDKTGDIQWRTFQGEVRNWADLPDHPNVVKCLYAGKYERRWFLVLEWVGAPEPGISARPRCVIHISRFNICRGLVRRSR